MSMIACQDCGHDVPHQGYHCPNCGATLRHRSSRLVILGSAGSIIIGLALWLVQDSDKPSSLGPQKAMATQTQPVKLHGKPNNQGQSPTNSSENSAYSTPAGTIERLVEENIIEIMGPSLLPTKKPLIKQITKSLDKEAGPGRYIITIYYRENIYDSPSETLTKMLDHIRLVGCNLFSENELGQITTFVFMPNISPTISVVDSQEEPYGKMILRRSIAEMTDWQHIDNNELMSIISREEQFWLHKNLLK